MRSGGGGDRSHLMLTLKRDTTAPRLMRPSKTLVANTPLVWVCLLVLFHTQFPITLYAKTLATLSTIRQRTMFAGYGRRTIPNKTALLIAVSPNLHQLVELMAVACGQELDTVSAMA